jgi:RNA polymerase sigma factor (sigma-70 family)
MAATPDAFTSFYESDYPRVLRAVSLILGDSTRSARISQEAFVRTHAAWRRVQGDRAFHYALRCAFRLAWRVRSHDEADLVLEDDPIAPTPSAPAALVAPAAPAQAAHEARPEPAGVTIDLRDDDDGARDVDLELALSSLPRAQRSVIVFWYYLGLDERSIAEVMSIRESQVAVHLERARTRLMALLGEDRTGVA